jgi:hypothetical protein
VRLQFRNLATSLFFLVYTIVYVVEPLVLNVFFEGARSIVAGRPDFFTDQNVYLIFCGYGFLLLITTLVLGSPSHTQRAAPKAVLAPRNHDYLSILIVFGFGLWVLATGMSPGELLNASRFEWYSAQAFSPFWLIIGGYFMALASIHTYYVVVGSSSKSGFAIAFAALLLHSFISKDRKWILFLASGLIAAIYDRSGRRLVVQKKVLPWIAVVFVVLVVSGFIRDVGFRYWLAEEVDMIDEVDRWKTSLIEYGDISYFYRASLEAIHQNLNNGFVVPFALVRRLALFIIPAPYSGGLKVDDISALFSDVVGGEDGRRRGNMPPGLYGLFVISFGWLASFVLIPLLAVFLRLLDQMIYRRDGLFRNTVISLAMFSIVLGFRGDDSSAFYYVMSTAMVVFAVEIIRPRAAMPVGAARGLPRSVMVRSTNGVSGRGAQSRGSVQHAHPRLER